LELSERRPSSKAALILGYFILTAATLLYAGLVYIAAIGFNEPVPGVTQGPLDFVRHVILIPGFFPWLLTATWVVSLHLGGSVPRGLGFILLSIFIHYVVFAVSAHSDVAYPWFQGIEFVIATYCVASMIRNARTVPSSPV
jgi:hypothetical protein